MNARITHSLDGLQVLMTQKESPPPRQVVDVLADGLSAVREGEEQFRASLDERQRGQLQSGDLDFTQQVDTAILLTRFVPISAATNSNNDD